MLKRAYIIYDSIKRRSKRKPYVRSQYFKRDKIFLDYFWEHLFAKQNLRDKQRRIALYAAAIELIQSTTLQPESKENPNDRKEILHRFRGRTKEKDTFAVQIKEDKKTGKKYFISAFPEY